MDSIETEAKAEPTPGDEERHVRFDGVASDWDGRASLHPEAEGPPFVKSGIDELPCEDPVANIKPEKIAEEDSSTAQPPSGPTINADGAKGPVVQGPVGGDVIDRNYRAGRDLHQHFANLPPDILQALLSQKEVKPLLDLTGDFPPHDSDLSWLESTTIDKYHQVLKAKRLLFIICPDRTIARASASAIVKKLGLTEAAQKRLLDFQMIAQESSIPTVYRLRQSNDNGEGEREDAEIVIVVDAVDPKIDANNKGREFLDSILNDTFDSIGYQLQQNRISMVYLVDSQDIQARLKTVVDERTFDKDFIFPHWEIPFLRPILKPHFTSNYLELEKKILEQRDRWRPGDKRLFYEIKDLIKKGTLSNEIDSPSRDADPQAVATLLSGDDPILHTVVYVATFFPDLNSREFQRIVTLLLGEMTKTVTVPVVRHKEDGTPESIEVPQEKALVEIWNESMDKVSRQCSLITVPAPDGTRTIDFKDHRLREQLKAFLQDEYAFFVTSQFQRLFEAGVLFDPSVKVGENMVALTAAIVASDPDYLVGQLVNIIGEIENGLTANGVRDNPAPALEMLVGLEQFQTNHQVYQRISALVRTLLDEYQLNGPVGGFLEQLMRRKLFEAVLKIVRRLRLTAGFDEAYWLKQLFERGDKDASLLTFAYLYGTLKSNGGRVYQVLKTLDSWVPEQAPLDRSPSTSGTEALSLLLAYCMETTASFDPNQYGVWPSRHPLFAFRDTDSAKHGLNLLARWLFHPWIESVLSDDDGESSIDELIAALTFEWSLILIGPSGKLAVSLKTGESAFAFGATEVQRILIEQIVAFANPRQHANLVSWWKAQSREMIELITQSPSAGKARHELIWRRNLLDDLITQFRDLVETKETSMRASSP